MFTGAHRISLLFISIACFAGANESPEAAACLRSSEAGCEDELVLLQANLKLTHRKEQDASLAVVNDATLVESLAEETEDPNTDGSGTPAPQALDMSAMLSGKTLASGVQATVAQNKNLPLSPMEKHLLELHPHYTLAYVNSSLFWIIVAVCVAVGAGLIVDNIFFVDGLTANMEKRQTQSWAISMLVTSYILLVLGLSTVFFRGRLFMSLNEDPLLVVARDNHGLLFTNIPKDMKIADVPDVTTDSVFTFAAWLIDVQKTSRAIVLCICTVVVPTVKLVSLLVGQCLRESSNPKYATVSTYCIKCFQFLSKWTAPELFSIILLINLMRSLDSRPLMFCEVRMDVGFNCMVISCITSMISSLMIEVPTPPAEVVALPKGPPFVLRVCGLRGVLAIALSGLVVFVGALTVGCFQPILYTVLKPGMMTNAPSQLTDMISMMGMEAMLEAPMSIDSLLAQLWKWQIEGGDASCGLSFFMVSLLMLGCTGLHMAANVMYAYELQAHRTRMESDEKELLHAIEIREHMRHTLHALDHMTMLDTGIAGMIVMPWGCKIYESVGLFVHFRQGLLWLIFAEAVRLGVAYIVRQAGDFVTESDLPLDSERSWATASSRPSTTDEVVGPPSEGSEGEGKESRPIGYLMAATSAGDDHGDNDGKGKLSKASNKRMTSGKGGKGL
eukprot:gnl/TRDRNA2_/TRDRNA2_172066_c3_seq8.p1 gnl/TRDRNA2_/TRDRNA2_172066_c3~~gnl/TRDRNA2_/TRDRNA2_172066_c3_seq8.p1  ORF type:complete len:673 (-),score=122.01 gnl/TRDRNA2_/TRDRNA2_172066_c3_seq8:84-2102(-)